jgi:hypothetical protein
MLTEGGGDSVTAVCGGKALADTKSGTQHSIPVLTEGDGNSVTTVCGGEATVTTVCGGKATDKFIESSRLTTDGAAAAESNWSALVIAVFEGGRCSFNRDPRRPEAKVGHSITSLDKQKYKIPACGDEGFCFNSFLASAFLRASASVSTLTHCGLSFFVKKNGCNLTGSFNSRVTGSRGSRVAAA